jgi:GNAT superfamily N-acetyltransferase
MEWKTGEFILTDTVAQIDVQRTYELLAQTYWAIRRPYAAVEKMVKHSLCFSLLHGDIQVGFGRAVTDYTVFSWLADIVIEPQHRGAGLGKWMMSCIVQHPLLQGTQMVLQTLDAHGLYQQYGFAQNPALMSTAVRSSQ